MFNFWDPQAAELYASMMKPYAELTRMWTSATSPPPPAQNFGHVNQFDNAFRSFHEALQTQSMGALGSNYFANLLKTCSFNPMQHAAQFNQPFGQMPQMPAMPPNANFATPSHENLPALGIAREWQEDFAKLMTLQQENAAAQQKFLELFSNYSANVGERVKNELNDIDLENLTFEQLCRIWIDCCEEEFQIIASSKQYAIAYGASLNASMRIRRQTDRMLEKSARLQNMPTRKEIDALHRSRAQANERESQLLQRIDQLEREVSRLNKPAARKKSAATATNARKRTADD